MVHRRIAPSARLPAVLVAVCASAAGADVFKFTSIPSQSSAATTSLVEAPYSGSLIGDYDPVSNPGGTRTIPGLFGGSGNHPIPISGKTAAKGDNQTSPAATFTLEINSAKTGVVLSEFDADLLNGAQPGLEFSISLLYQSFHTVAPSALFPGGFPVTLPLGEVKLTLLTATQVGGPAAGTLLPDGQGGFTFAVVAAFEVTLETDAGLAPASFILPVPIAGALTISGQTAAASIEFELEQNQTIPGPIPGPQDLPFDLPTVLPPGEIAHVLVSAEFQEVATSFSMAAQLGAAGEAACIADFNGDGVLNIDDFISFQIAFAVGSPKADLNKDGVLNIDDFIVFQLLFALGC